jgi:hypothetical protein
LGTDAEQGTRGDGDNQQKLLHVIFLVSFLDRSFIAAPEAARCAVGHREDRDIGVAGFADRAPKSGSRASPEKSRREELQGQTYQPTTALFTG